VQWWLVWTIVVGAVVVLSAALVAVPAMGVRRRLAELNRVTALLLERTTARTQKLAADSERVRATVAGVQHRTGGVRRKIKALKAGRTSDAAALAAADAPAAEGRGAPRPRSGRQRSGGGAGRR
jgi:hypothetical protein